MQPSSSYSWPGEPQRPVTLVPGQWVKSPLGPRQLWLAKLAVTRPATHQFNITLIEGSGGASLAVFGRHLDHPSVTRHDWVEYVHSDLGASPSVAAELSEGSWYLAIYNDGDTELEFGLVASALVGGAECPSDCHAPRGRCVGGRCRCEAQYTGEDCSASVCPVVCSGHGRYGGGACHCERGWKGAECSVREEECEVPDCGGHGDCAAGVCQCQPGWSGQFCDQREYQQPLHCCRLVICAANRLIGEVVQSRRRPLLGPSPG